MDNPSQTDHWGRSTSASRKKTSDRNRSRPFFGGIRRTRLDARSCTSSLLPSSSRSRMSPSPPSHRVVRKEIAHTTNISRHQQLSAGSARWSGRTKPRRAVRIYLLIFTQLPVTCVASPSVWKGDRDVNTLCLPPSWELSTFPCTRKGSKGSVSGSVWTRLGSKVGSKMFYC